MRRRITAAIALVAGLLVMSAARVAIPEAPPLYDGVVVIPPYQWVDPPPGQPGDAQGASATIAARGHKSPLLALATPEMAPQAQILAVPGDLTLPPGTRHVLASIRPIAAEGAPASGHIDGNVYRITVTDEHGTPLTAPPSSQVTVVLRPTDPSSTDGTIARYVDGAWHPIKGSSGGFGGSLLAVIREFGDFAVIAPGPGADGLRRRREPTRRRPAPCRPIRRRHRAPRHRAQAGARSLPAPTTGAPDWLVPGHRRRGRARRVSGPAGAAATARGVLMVRDGGHASSR